MKQHLGALIFLAMVLAGFSAWFLFKTDPHDDALAMRTLATQGLAEHLSKVFAGKKALVIANPFIRQSGTSRRIVAMEEAGLRGLRQGFHTRVAITAVVFPELHPEARSNPGALLAGVDTTTPLSYLVTSNAFDHLIQQHPDCEVIVSLIGLPADLKACAAWNRADGPKFALLLPDLRIIGEGNSVEEALTSGKLAAFVMQRPAGSEKGGEFADHFILVTRETFNEVRRRFPNLFPSPHE